MADLATHLTGRNLPDADLPLIAYVVDSGGSEDDVHRSPDLRSCLASMCPGDIVARDRLHDDAERYHRLSQQANRVAVRETLLTEPMVWVREPIAIVLQMYAEADACEKLAEVQTEKGDGSVGYCRARERHLDDSQRYASAGLRLLAALGVTLDDAIRYRDERQYDDVRDIWDPEGAWEAAERLRAIHEAVASRVVKMAGAIARDHLDRDCARHLGPFPGGDLHRWEARLGLGGPRSWRGKADVREALTIDVLAYLVVDKTWEHAPAEAVRAALSVRLLDAIRRLVVVQYDLRLGAEDYAGPRDLEQLAYDLL